MGGFFTKIFASSLALGFFALALANAETPIVPVAIFLNLAGAQRPNLGPEKKVLAELERQYLEQFPERKVYGVVARDANDLKEKLDGLLQPGENISHFWLHGHGAATALNLPLTIGEDLQTLILPGTKAVIAINGSGSTPDSRLEFNSVLNTSLPQELLLESINFPVIEVFRGLRGRFASGAKLYLYACSLFQGSAQHSQARARAIAHALGLQNGEIFSHTDPLHARPVIVENEKSRFPSVQRSLTLLKTTLQKKLEQVFHEHILDRGLIYRLKEGKLQEGVPARSRRYWAHFFSGRDLNCQDDLL